MPGLSLAQNLGVQTWADGTRTVLWLAIPQLRVTPFLVIWFQRYDWSLPLSPFVLAWHSFVYNYVVMERVVSPLRGSIRCGLFSWVRPGRPVSHTHGCQRWTSVRPVRTSMGRHSRLGYGERR